MEMVTVGCRLMNGVDLRVNDSTTIRLNGKNKAIVIGADCGYTQVDKALMDEWFERKGKHSPLVQSKIIFYHEQAESTQSIAREYSAIPTGFDPLPQNDGNIRGA